MTAADRSPLDLHGKRILVTGASSGLGREIAVCLSGLGASLVLVGRNHARLQEAARCLTPGEHATAEFDLQDVEAIPRWLTETAVAGPLHGLVHSAGVHLIRPLKATSIAGYEELMRVNVTAAMSLAQAFRQPRVHAGDSAIVFLSSVMALVGQPGLAAYCTSKAALGGLTRALALELAKERIRVNCVAPGQVDTGTGMSADLQGSLTESQWQQLAEMHPLGFGRPEDVACAVAFLVARTGRWITGTTLVDDGGNTAR